MNNKATYTWIILIILTLISAFVSKTEGTYIVLIVLVLSAVKFLGIAFQFMDLKKAHEFWITLTVGFIFLFGIGLLLVWPN